MKAIAVLAVSLLALASGKQVGEGIRTVPPPTSEGSFEGSWYYVDPAYKIAIFISRNKREPLTIRYHLQDKKKAIDFETNAKGQARYLDDGYPVEVLFTGRANPEQDRIDGRYERKASSKDATRVQSGQFQMYRAREGKILVLQYPELRTEVRNGSRVIGSTKSTDIMMIFRKASNMVIEFEEIPF